MVSFVKCSWLLLDVDDYADFYSFAAHVREWERPKEGTGDEPMEKL